MTTRAQDLLRKLGLSIRTNGPTGRYPTAHRGPAEGYAHFAAPLDGKIRFGIQGVPIRPLNGLVLDKLARHGFQPTNKHWGTCMLIDDLSPASLETARHVWTAPSARGLNWVILIVVGCCHVSGLLARCM